MIRQTFRSSPSGKKFNDWVFDDEMGGVIGITATSGDDDPDCDCGLAAHFTVLTTADPWVPRSPDEANKLAQLFSALADGKIPNLEG